MKRAATTPAVEPAEPAEPTVVEPAADSATNPPEPPKDSYEARFKATQATLTRTSQENAALRARLREYESADDDGGSEVEDEADDEPAPPPPVSSRFRAAETPRRAPESEDAAELGRSVAEAVHGADVVSDYDRAMQLLAAATTEADRVTAFATFAELRNRAAPSVPRPASSTGASRSREDVITPTVQTNRPDGPMYVDETDPGLYRAGQNGGVKGYVKALLGGRSSR